MIEERNPLKQGLKRTNQKGLTVELWKIEERNPLKQGLKHNGGDCAMMRDVIEERNPLKQGLKLFF